MSHREKDHLLAIRFFIIGTTSLVIMLILNGFEYVVLRQPEAMSVYTAWWSTWFPLYVVWFSFLLVGLGLSLQQNLKR